MTDVYRALPLVDLVSDWDFHKEAYEAAMRRVCSSARFVLGDEVAAFEEEFAQECGVAYAVGVASGTDALSLSLRATGIGEGDEVVVPALTFAATAEAVLHVGARPIFADVDPSTGLMGVEEVERAAMCGSRIRAVIPVHLYGLLCDMGPLVDWASQRGAIVIEDAAQAHGASAGGVKAGAAGQLGCFSFYPGKNLGAFGDGGAVVTNDARLAATLRRLRDHGRESKYEHLELGYCSRLDALQAAVLRVKLARLGPQNEARRSVAMMYRKHLEGAIPLLGGDALDRGEPAHHIFGVLVPADRRAAIAAALREAGVASGIHYPRIVPDNPAFGSRPAEQWPGSARIAAQELSLPMHPYLHAADVDRVSSLILDLAG